MPLAEAAPRIVVNGVEQHESRPLRGVSPHVKPPDHVHSAILRCTRGASCTFLNGLGAGARGASPEPNVQVYLGIEVLLNEVGDQVERGLIV